VVTNEATAARERDKEMTHLTTLDELRRHISVLASVEETGAPFVSAYFDLEDGPSDGQLRRPIANCLTRVSCYVAFAGVAAASQAGIGP